MEVRFPNGSVGRLGFRHSAPGDTPRTTSAMLDVGGGAYIWGWATCSPEDNFEKEKGRKIALTRLARVFDRKEDRRAIWQAYLGRKEKRNLPQVEPVRIVGLVACGF